MGSVLGIPLGSARPLGIGIPMMLGAVWVGCTGGVVWVTTGAVG